MLSELGFRSLSDYNRRTSLEHSNNMFRLGNVVHSKFRILLLAYESNASR